MYLAVPPCNITVSPRLTRNTFGAHIGAHSPTPRLERSGRYAEDVRTQVVLAVPIAQAGFVTVPYVHTNVAMARPGYVQVQLCSVQADGLAELWLWPHDPTEQRAHCQQFRP